MIQHIWRKYRAHVEVRGEDDAFNRLEETGQSRVCHCRDLLHSHQVVEPG